MDWEKETEIAWAAGFFEGEGTVGVYSTGNKGYPTWLLTTTVSQVDGSPMKRFMDIVGIGRLRLLARRGPKWRPVWRWEADAAKAADVLAMIYPYLSGVKREQARLALEYRGIQEKDGRTGAGRPVPTFAERALLASQIKSLKHVTTEYL